VLVEIMQGNTRAIFDSRRQGRLWLSSNVLVVTICAVSLRINCVPFAGY
jgi:hypothetical protein